MCHIFTFFQWVIFILFLFSASKEREEPQLSVNTGPMCAMLLQNDSESDVQSQPRSSSIISMATSTQISNVVLRSSTVAKILDKDQAKRNSK